MTRSRYPSDEKHNEERRLGPRPGSYYITHHSVSHHRKTVDVYADNDLYATWHRVMQLASEKGAAQTEDRLELSMTDALQVTKRSRSGVALALIQRLVGQTQWRYLEPTWSRSGWIEVRNLARKQGIAPRKPRSITQDSAASPTASATITPIAPNGGGVSGSERRLERRRSADKASALYAAWDTAVRSSFDRFWSVYPRKVAKAAAVTAWQGLGPPSEPQAEKIISAASNQAREWVRERRQLDKTPHPATWLNGERWEDEIPNAATIAAQNAPRFVY